MRYLLFRHLALLIVVIAFLEQNANALSPNRETSIGPIEPKLIRSQTTRERSTRGRSELGSALGRAAFKLKCAGEVCFVRAPINTGHAIGHSFNKLGGWLQKQSKAFKEEVTKPSKAHEEWRLKRQSSRRPSRAGSEHNSLDASPQISYQADANVHRHVSSRASPGSRPSVDAFPELRMQKSEMAKIVPGTPVSSPLVTTLDNANAIDPSEVQMAQNKGEEDVFAATRPVPKLSLPPMPPVSPKVSNLIDRIEQLQRSIPSSSHSRSRSQDTTAPVVIGGNEFYRDDFNKPPSNLASIRTKFSSSTSASIRAAAKPAQSTTLARGSPMSMWDAMQVESVTSTRSPDRGAGPPQQRPLKGTVENGPHQNTEVSSSPARYKSGISQRTPPGAGRPKPPKSPRPSVSPHDDSRLDDPSSSAFRHGRLVQLPLGDFVAIDAKKKKDRGNSRKTSRHQKTEQAMLNTEATEPRETQQAESTASKKSYNHVEDPLPRIGVFADRKNGGHQVTAASPPMHEKKSIDDTPRTAPITEQSAINQNKVIPEEGSVIDAHPSNERVENEPESGLRQGKEGHSSNQKSERLLRAKSVRDKSPKRKTLPYERPEDVIALRDRRRRQKSKSMSTLSDPLPFDVSVASPVSANTVPQTKGKRKSKKRHQANDEASGYEGGDNESGVERSSSTSTSQRSQRSSQSEQQASSTVDKVSKFKAERQRPSPLNIPKGVLVSYRTNSGGILYPESVLTPDGEDQDSPILVDTLPQSKEDLTQLRNVALHHPLSP